MITKHQLGYLIRTVFLVGFDDSIRNVFVHGLSCAEFNGVNIANSFEEAEYIAKGTVLSIKEFSYKFKFC